MSKDQYVFYSLLRKHASEWNRAYNKCIGLKHNYQIGTSCLSHAETFNNLADYISKLGTANWKRWQYFNSEFYGFWFFRLTDLYGQPEVKQMPTIRTGNRPSAPAQLALF